jgi:catechol 2,3-dioxygenase-like lactoylglutathione lyase family enzyme
VDITRISHVNINCSSLARSKPFYEEVVGVKPITHTNPDPQPLGGFGFDTGQWDAYIMRDASPESVAVDLLEWKLPTPIGQPYPTFNNLGYYRLCFATQDIQKKYQDVVARGIECHSPPVTGGLGIAERPDATVTFFICKDPDGTAIEFVQSNRDGISHVNINCSDLERSRTFYENLLGVTPTSRSTSPLQPGQGFGYDGQVAWDAYFFSMQMAGAAAPFIIDLLEWKEPKPVSRPYPTANNLGIFRMAFITPDIDQCYQELMDMGANCLSEPGLFAMGEGLPPAKVLLFTDPDGTMLEFIETTGARA